MKQPGAMATRNTVAPDRASRPWWRFAYLWLIIGIFAVAIAGGLITVYLAMQAPEASGAASGAAAQAAPADGALEPAMQARNRAGSHNARALGLGGEK